MSTELVNVTQIQGKISSYIGQNTSEAVQQHVQNTTRPPFIPFLRRHVKNIVGIIAEFMRHAMVHHVWQTLRHRHMSLKLEK